MDILRVPKNDKKSTKYRTAGNDLFDKRTMKDYLKALKYYNLAICFATSNSETLCLAYADRSAVFFELFMFEDCVENIKLVKEIDKYPAHLRDELNSRETACKTIMGIEDPYNYQWIEPKLSFPRHEKVPYIANCLELRQNKQFGNHVVTNRDLKVGDIVGIVEPYVTAQAERYQHERCENCCKERSQNLLPCPNCTVAMFCDEKCLKEAMDGFHKYECVAIDLIDRAIRSQRNKLALRVITKGLSIYQDVDKFLDMTAATFKKNVNVFEIDHDDIFDQYTAVCSLKRAATTGTISADVTILVTLCETIFIASNITSKKKPQELKKTLKHVVRQQLLMVDMNGLLFDDLSYHIVKKRCPLYDDKCSNNNMSGIYPFIQLFPHSCIPNVICSSFTNGKIVSVLRPIKAGQQLFHSFA